MVAKIAIQNDADISVFSFLLEKESFEEGPVSVHRASVS